MRRPETTERREVVGGIEKKRTYSLDPSADVDGTYMHLPLVGVTAAELASAFGPGTPDGSLGPGDRGGPTWRFTDSTGQVYNVYSRWGEYRIGSRDESPHDRVTVPHGSHTQAFKTWLLGQIDSVGKRFRN